MRLAAGVAATIASATLVSAASASESTIDPGVGIGKVKLGMTKAQVERVLGRDSVRYGTKTVAGRRYVEHAWDWSHWRVTFELHGGTLRAVQVVVDLKTQRTAKRVGVGSRWLDVVRAYPGGRCAFGGRLFKSEPVEHVEYLVPRKGGAQTIFNFAGILANPFVATGPQTIVGYAVVEVRVRRPFEPNAEFAPDARPEERCKSGWQKTEAPEHG
jgi:hypothetical protein